MNTKRKLPGLLLALLVLATAPACQHLFRGKSASSAKGSYKLSAALLKKIQAANSLKVDLLDINAIEGLPSNPGDSVALHYLPFEDLEVNLESVNPNSVAVQENGRLSIRSVQVDSLEYDARHGERRAGVPYRIPQLRFRKVTLKYQGKPVKTFLQYQQADFTVASYSLQPADPATEGAQNVNVRVDDIQERIKKLQSEIKEILAAQPDHAVQQFIGVLDGLALECQQIKEKYRNRLPKLSSINLDLDNLFSIELTVADMETEVADPAEATTIRTNVLFNSGEYLLTQPHQFRQLDVEVHKIMERIRVIQRQHPDRNIKLALVVTGYADDQAISGALKKDLLARSRKTTAKGNEQDFLNQLLSKERANSVLQYLHTKITSAVGANKLEFLPNGAVGKGRTDYPAHLTAGTCPGDCQERRVVVISTANYSTD